MERTGSPALGGHKLEVAFDALGGKAIDDLAEVVDVGGTIINFGSLDSNMGTNIYALAPKNVALKSVSIMSWFRLSQDEKQQDFGLALSLAKNHPELFEVAHEYPGAMAATVEEAAARETVVLAVPWDNVPQTLASLPKWKNQILIDATNPFHGKAGNVCGRGARTHGVCAH